MVATLEREIKLRFDSPDAARAAIVAIGARPLHGRRLQDDRLLDRADNQLQQQRSVLRVRTEDGRCVLTFKGPVQPSLMKLREEIDALKVLGLDPIEVLVLPRVIALIIMLPVLAFLGGMLGLVGGGLVAWTAMEISPALFVGRLQETIGMSNLWVGLIKAPFFAFAIAVVGCFQGMQVEGSAESLGQRTTLSVVQALFLVIVLDAFFAMFFLEIDF